MIGLTQQLKDESIKKWERFLIDCKNHKKKGYIYEYWNPCGFCRAVENNKRSCRACDLNYIEKKGMTICYSGAGKVHAFCAVKYASESVAYVDRSFWKKAIYHGRMVLNSIKKAKIDRRIE